MLNNLWFTTKLPNNEKEKMILMFKEPKQFSTSDIIFLKKDQIQIKFELNDYLIL